MKCMLGGDDNLLSLKFNFFAEDSGDNFDVNVASGDNGRYGFEITCEIDLDLGRRTLFPADNGLGDNLVGDAARVELLTFSNAACNWSTSRGPGSDFTAAVDLHSSYKYTRKYTLISMS